MNLKWFTHNPFRHRSSWLSESPHQSLSLNGETKKPLVSNSTYYVVPVIPRGRLVLHRAGCHHSHSTVRQENLLEEVDSVKNWADKLALLSGWLISVSALNRGEQRRQVRQLPCACSQKLKAARRRRDAYLELSFAEAKPVWEVKQGVSVIFEGEGGVSPHGLDFC